MNSGCRNARELFSLSLDGELSKFEQHKLERHLRDCAACRRYGAMAAAITFALRGAPLERFSVSMPECLSRTG
jgi:predicted anti-sigma-YlaC factor YlaD